tara:strand:- start:515 stop:1723 length:1209 start_codon:yes stop_codon:yes gene_type:complete
VYKNPYKLVLQNACENYNCINSCDCSCDCSCECSSKCCDDQIDNNYEYAEEYYQYLHEYNKLEDTELNFLKSNKDDSKINYVEFAKKRQDKYKTFETNLKLISDYNNNGDETCVLELNKFTDEVDISIIPNDLMLMNEPLKHNNFSIERKIRAIAKFILNPFRHFNKYKNLPEKLVWENDVLSEVKNQGNCGSCWAFSSTSAIESYMRINNYTVDRLSEQQLVDCSKENNGCEGGLMHLAFDYCIQNNGLVSNDDYTYVAEGQLCAIDCNDQCLPGNHSFNGEYYLNVIGSNITSYEYILPRSMLDIMASLQNGPIAIALDASSFIFRFYKKGVIDIPSRMSEQINHAVLLTGYDRDENGTYWIIQNSWGKDWGDNGFVKLRARDGDGVLLSQVYGVYPKYK